MATVLKGLWLLYAGWLVGVLGSVLHCTVQNDFAADLFLISVAYRSDSLQDLTSILRLRTFGALKDSDDGM